MKYADIRSIAQDVVRAESQFERDKRRYTDESIAALESKLDALTDHLGLHIVETSGPRVIVDRPEAAIFNNDPADNGNF